MKVPATSTLVWRDYATDPPDTGGIFMVLRRPAMGAWSEPQYPAEADRLGAGTPEDPLEWFQCDGGDHLLDADILYWAKLPEVLLP